MTLNTEEWAKLESQLLDQYLVLINRDDLRSQLEAIQPQVIQTVMVESEIAIRDDLGFKPRRKGHWNIEDEEWGIKVGGLRDLEDLILECIDAGIDIELYL